MSLDVQIVILALDKDGKECFKYEPPTGYFGEIEQILSGESKMVQSGLLGMLTEEEIEYFKFKNPWDENENLDYDRIEIKDPAKLLSVLEKIKDHYIRYELKEVYKKDIAECDDNWMLSYMRSKLSLLVDIGKVMSILELAVQGNCKVKAHVSIM